MKLSAKATIYGCYLGYITQAIVNNLPPLLFLTFRREFGVTLDQISLLICLPTPEFSSAWSAMPLAAVF